MAPILGIAAVALIASLLHHPEPDRVVLLPGPDGKVGRVVVTTAQGESTLASAYAGTTIAASGKLEAVTESEASVRQRYGATLAAQPPRPAYFRVYFLRGGDQLTPESQAALAALKDELAKHPAPEVNVIGHTDSVGSDEVNDKLSYERAEVVRKLMIQQGVSAGSIAASGRGKRQPLVPTADGVDEPRNRRVEIEVR